MEGHDHLNSHLDHHLALLQDKLRPPRHVIDAVRDQVKTTPVTPSIVKEALRTQRLVSYYEYIGVITAELNGETLPIIDTPTIDFIKSMFPKIRQVCRKHQKSLGFSYIMNRLFQLAGREDLMGPFVNSREKLEQQNRFWGTICEELDLECNLTTFRDS